ncbi:MAG: transcription-repair coupling factor [Pseudohongiellaceae bacterium]
MTDTDIFAPPLPRESGVKVRWRELHGSSLSLAICVAAGKHDGPVLVVCDNNENAEQLRRELSFFCAGLPDFPVYSFPDWETLPYDTFSPHQDIISDRLSSLHHLPQMRRGILIIAFNSLMHRLPPRDYITGRSLVLKTGQQFSIDTMRQNLTAGGYQTVDTVFEHGEFAVRGAIMDIFPMGSQVPYRIDLLDDEIDTLRSFDPETQRTISQVEEIRLLPGREFPLDEKGVHYFRGRFRERFDVDLRTCPIYQDVSEGLASPGLEYYLDLFFDHLATLFDYLPDDTLALRTGNLEEAGNDFWNDIKLRYDERSVDRYRPILSPGEIFLTVGEVLGRINQLPSVQIDHVTIPAGGDRDERAIRFDARPLPDLEVQPKLQKPTQALQDFIANQPAARILFCVETAGRREALLEMLGSIKIKPDVLDRWDDFLQSGHHFAITVAPIDRSLWLAAQKLVLITESQLFGGKIAQRRRRGKAQHNSELIIRNLTELHLGDAVVHLEHGVGRYRGLQTLTIDNQATEFLTLEYARESRLYVPVSSLHLVSRYSGADTEHAPLHHLGSGQWEKTRRKAAEKIRDVAAELLDIYARREANKGVSYRTDDIDYEKFAADFPFEETEDQESTIAAVLADMKSVRKMDRLVCGDVGFGKTEVAMRAAFIAVQNNKQVAILVPTTLLAQQHFESFRDRFADWPIVVDVISRFRSASEQRRCLNELKAGKIDILIGTHKLLQESIKYEDLGLLIIDEEHRFGVRQKERLKAIRSNVDVLTLTATPIPRTLNLALSGIRDLSLITTPPAKRLSVKTFIRPQQDSLIQEAVQRELLRGGQVFFLHNEVSSIEKAADHLRDLLPQARLCIAHGQMPERELEKVMADFYHKRYNVLVCSTIIETGIDIPSANTILIHRADRLGLAQLHQLRGRVGRSHHQAYAYLLTPPHGRMTADAQKRIEAIQAATALGAGFTLASHDLEIRGAGEFLGEEQSGHMQKIGFTLYAEMLDEAVKAIRAGRIPSADLEPDEAIDINLRIPALIPEDYLPDVHGRLIMYKRISAAGDEEELKELQVEMIDRFGLLPPPLKLLFRQTALKLRAKTYGIKKIDAGSAGGRIEFGQNTRVDPLSIVKMVQAEPQRYKLASANQVNFKHETADADGKLEFIDDMLQQFKLVSQQAA